MVFDLVLLVCFHLQCQVRDTLLRMNGIFIKSMFCFSIRYETFLHEGEIND